MKIRKGDRVRVLSGKDRGKEGTVMFALPAERKVIVEGVNVAKHHQKPTQKVMQGGIIDRDMPIDVSNVGIICGSCHAAARIGYRTSSTGEKIRVCRKCGADL